VIRSEREHDRITVTLNRPDKKNAVNSGMLSELDRALRESARDESVRLLVLRGQGGCFCAGADIRELKGFDAAGMREYHDLRERVFGFLENFPCPTLSVIEGYALGTGLELALCTDFRLASGDAWFGVPSSKLGVTESYLYLSRLIRCVGSARARFLVLTGERISAEEARVMGLVERVYPPQDLRREVSALTEAMGGNAVQAMRRSKRVLAECARDPYVTGISDPARPMLESMELEEMAEGTGAFLDKRRSHFEGREGD